MTLLTLQHLKANAFRILGVGGDSGWEAICNAAAPTPEAGAYELPWLGVVDRSPASEDDAKRRLCEPASRVAERMIWFCGAAAQEALANVGRDVSRLDGAIRQLERSGKVEDQHDAAAAELHAALFMDSAVNDLGRWGRTVGKFVRLADSDEHQAWMMKLEETGGFAPPATPEQVSAARQAMAAQVTGLLAGKADVVLAAGVAARAGEILRVLRATGAPGLAPIEQRILTGMEETLGRRGQELSDQLASTIVPGNVAAVGRANVRQAQLGVTFYNEHVGPALAAIESACTGSEHHERLLRARGMAAVTMGNLGQAWLYAGDFAAADDALTAAVTMGTGTWAEGNLRQDLAENAPRAALQRQGVAPKKVARQYPMRPRKIVQPNGGVAVRAPEKKALWIIIAVILWLGIQGAQWYWLRPTPRPMPLPPRIVTPPPPRVPAYPMPATPGTP